MTGTCQHEPYHGKCVHCDAPFVNGRAIVAPATVAAPVQVKAHAMTDHDNLIDRLEESAAIYQQHTLKALLSEAAAALHEASLAIDDADKSRRISDRERDEAVNALRAISGDTSNG